MLTSLPVDLTTCLVALVTFLLVWLTIRRPRGLPPGPLLSVPLLGYVPFIRVSVVETLRELRQTYGDIFHLYLGPKLVIVLSGYELIREALVQHGNEFSHRPSSLGFKEFGNTKGIFNSSGTVWREQRRFATEALRTLGVGTNKLQENILQEVGFFLSELEDSKGKAFDVKLLLHTAVSNVICKIVFSKRFPYNDAGFHRLLRVLDKMLNGGMESMVQKSFLRNLPGDITGYKAALRDIRFIQQDFLEVSIHEHLQQFQPDSINDFTDAYIKEMKEKERQQTETTLTGGQTTSTGSQTTLTDDHLCHILMDLFLAGTESTATTIRWALVYLLHYPHTQDRLQVELRDKLGSSRLPTVEDRPELPFLSAFIMEVLRHACIAPLAAPHAASVDFPLRGYRIPRDTMVFINLQSVLKDPKVWKDPDVFNPDRFLVDGKLFQPKQFIPFGLGHRVCLGESLAKMELFLFLAPMLQRFRFEPADNQPLPPLRGIQGGNHIPRPFPIKAVLRI